MYKLISIALIMSACFAIDPIAYEKGFSEISHAGELNEVLIDTNVAINIDRRHETIKCQSLQISEGAELAFTKSAALKKAALTVNVSKEAIIKGRLTVAENISLTLISERFDAQNGHISAPILTVKSDDINVIASEILSDKLTLGVKFSTKVINFDKYSKITGTKPCSYIDFYADDIIANGEIKGEGDGVTKFHVKQSINIDDLSVLFNKVQSYDPCSHDMVKRGLHIHFFAIEDFKLEHSENAFLANVLRLLNYTNVQIKSVNKLSVCSKISSEAPEHKQYFLTLSAPLIDIGAAIEIENLCIYGAESHSSSLDYSDFHKLTLSGSDGKFLVKNLNLQNIHFSFALHLEGAKYLYASRSCFKMHSQGMPHTLHNYLSKIALNLYDCSSALNKYIIGNHYGSDQLHAYYDHSFDKATYLQEPLFYQANTVVFKNVNLGTPERRITGLKAESIRAEKSKFYINHIKELKNLYSDDSEININVPSEFILEHYTIKGTYSISDELVKHTKSLSMIDINMDDAKSLDLSHITNTLYVKDSKITIKSFGKLIELTRDRSIIKSQPYKLEKYTVIGSKEGVNAFYCDRLYQKAESLHIHNVDMSLHLNLENSKELYIEKSKVNIKFFGVLSKLVIDAFSAIKCVRSVPVRSVPDGFFAFSAIKCVRSVPDGFFLDEYTIRGLSDQVVTLPDDNLYKYAKKLYMHNITMDESQSLSLEKNEELYLENSKISIGLFGALNKVERDTLSRIIFTDDIACEYLLQNYIINGVERCGLNVFDGLIDRSKCLHLNNISVEDSESLALTKTKSLFVKNSKFSINSFGELNTLLKDTLSNIQYISGLPEDFLLDSYTILGVGDVDGYTFDDELLNRAIHLHIYNINMDETQTLAIENTKYLDVIKSKVKIDSIINLCKLEKDISSSVTFAVAIPEDYLLQEYSIYLEERAVCLQEDSLLPIAKTLEINSGYAGSLNLVKTTHLKLKDCQVYIKAFGELDFIDNTGSNIDISYKKSKWHAEDEIIESSEAETTDISALSLSGYSMKIPSSSSIDSYIHDPVIHLAKHVLIESESSSSEEAIVDFPEFKKPLMEVLVFKNCRFNLDKIAAKELIFENSTISGDFLAQQKFSATGATFSLNQDNVNPATEIRLDESKITLTSDLEFLNLKAFNCDIDKKTFSLKAHAYYDTLIEATMPPLVNCTIIGIAS